MPGTVLAVVRNAPDSMMWCLFWREGKHGQAASNAVKYVIKYSMNS